MKIQAHAAMPPTPLISAMPRARIPPKAPASVAAEKNRAILKPHSCRQYHCVMLSTVPLSTPSTDCQGGDIIHLLVIDTGKQATLEDTEKDPRGHEPRVILDESLTNHGR